MGDQEKQGNRMPEPGTGPDAGPHYPVPELGSGSERRNSGFSCGMLASFGSIEQLIIMKNQTTLARRSLLGAALLCAAGLAQAAVERSRAALPIEADIRRLEAVALAR